jgi:hypothetical protein
MKYSDVKKIKSFCADLFSKPDYREVISNAGNDDFEVDGVRFISDSAIDQIQQDELSGDEYILGCFNAWFIADVIGIDLDVIEAMQKAEAFEAIGKLIISMGKLEELQSAYASADGYGHHFNGYDFGEEEITIDGTLYHVFDNH